MNWFGVFTVALGFLGYFLGRYCAQKITARVPAFLAVFVALVLALPAIIYDLYYAKALGEPIWLYGIRAVTGSELLLVRWSARRVGARADGPALAIELTREAISRPGGVRIRYLFAYLKPLLRPLRSDMLREEWKGEACLQSTPSTCGPAAAATIVRRLGGHLFERELAREAFTCSSGTENWYLARTFATARFPDRFPSE